MEYKAEDYIDFIESGRRDKISPDGLELIASRFRELVAIYQLVLLHLKKED